MSELRSAAIRGAKWTSFSSISRVGIYLVQLGILARLLTPEDFGLMALVTLVLSLCQLFSDLGISAAIIQQKNVTRSQLDSLFWINVFVAGILGTIIALCAPSLAGFFAEPRVEIPIVLGGIALFCIGVGRQHQALLQKELQFKTIALIEASGALMGLLAAVFTALLGWGVFALLASLLTKSVWSSAGYLIIGFRRHVPSMVLRFNEVKSYVLFGMYQTGQGLAGYVASQIDILILGRLLGVEALGLWSVAKELTLKPAMLINPILTRVAFPVFARMDTKAAMRGGYLRVSRLLASINSPIYLLMLALSPEIVNLVLGPEWLAAVPLLRLLACWGLLRSFVNPCGSLLLASGHVSYLLYWNLFVVFLITMSLSFVASHGLIAVGIMLILLQFALLILHVPCLLYRAAAIKIPIFVRSLVSPVAISLLCLIPAWFFSRDMGQIPAMTLALVSYAAVFSIASWFLNKPVVEDLMLFLRR